MFSRTTKSIVKSLGSRQFHIAEENLKHSRILRRIKQFRSVEASRSNSTINNSRRADTEILNFSNHQADNEKNQTERLVEALYHLPIAEEGSALNHPLLSSERISKAGNACRGIRPYAGFPGGIDSMKIWQKYCAIVAILKRFPGLAYPPFREHDVIPLAGISRKYRPIKIKRRSKGISWDALVTKRSNRQSSRQAFLLNDGERSVREPTKRFRNSAMLSETRRREAEKSASWVIIPAALRANKPKSLREIYNHDGRHIGRFPLKALVGIAHNISRRSSVNCTDYENNNGIVALDRNSEKMSHDVAEEENWIVRASSKIRSVLSDLRAKMQRRSTTVSDSYYSENVIAVNEAILVSDVLPDGTILFAPKDCDSKSSIRSKIEEFCAQRNKFLRRRVGEDDICKKRERSCKTAEKKCQGREKICLRKGTDCSERKRRTCQKRRKLSCERRASSHDKEGSLDCRETRKKVSRERPCKGYKVPFDKRRTKKESCAGDHGAESRRTSCERQRLEKDSCKRSDKSGYQRSSCRKHKKRAKDKEREEDTGAREGALCKGGKGRRGCEDRKEMTCKEEKGEEDSGCPGIKEIEPCRKKECPPVTKAPGCPED